LDQVPQLVLNICFIRNRVGYLGAQQFAEALTEPMGRSFDCFLYHFHF
jgi:hypothetical protein